MACPEISKGEGQKLSSFKHENKIMSSNTKNIKFGYYALAFLVKTFFFFVFPSFRKGGKAPSHLPPPPGASPGFGRGGAKKFFFSDLGICVLN